jgi:GATA-binding protein, other eukaryote
VSLIVSLFECNFERFWYVKLQLRTIVSIKYTLLFVLCVYVFISLSYKLHGSARPISMKSDVIRKRSRHDARRVSVASGNTTGPNLVDTTPSASPGASRRASPVMEPSPTLAPDCTTHVSYSSSESEYLHRPAHQQHHTLTQQSELSGALGLGVTGTNMGVGMILGQEPNPSANMNVNMSPSYRGANGDGAASPFGLFTFGMMTYPGPYNPDYLQQHYHTMHSPHHANNQLLNSDPLPFAALDGSEMESAAVNAASGTTSPSSSRGSKRRRMSVDSVSEPPSSAVSYGSFNDGYSSSAASSVSPPAMDYPYNHPTPYPSLVLRGSGNAYWHPTSGSHNSPRMFIHPPMLPSAFPGESDVMAAGPSALDFFHPPMMLPQEEENIFSSFIHPPMVLSDPEPVVVASDCTSPPPVQHRASPTTNGVSSSTTTSMQVHPPMMYPNEIFDSPMHSYG